MTTSAFYWDSQEFGRIESRYPKGRCYRKGIGKADKVVAPLSQMEPNREGRITYIHPKGEGSKNSWQRVLP